jgi:structural maintenance of chromosome 2
VIKEKKAAISQTDLDVQKLEHSIQALGKEKTAATNHVTSLEKQFEWILQDKGCVDYLLYDLDHWCYHHNREFGRPGSQYDFDSINVGQLREKVTELEHLHKGMKKKVNEKVINTIDG